MMMMEEDGPERTDGLHQRHRCRCSESHLLFSTLSACPSGSRRERAERKHLKEEEEEEEEQSVQNIIGVKIWNGASGVAAVWL